MATSSDKSELLEKKKDYGTGEAEADDASQNGTTSRDIRLRDVKFERDREEVAKSYEYTVEDAVECIGFGVFQWKLIFMCGMYSACDAFEMLLLAVLSPVIRCEWQLEEWQVALLTTIVFVGMFIGSPIYGSWSDTYGRLPVLGICASLMFYFGILTALSPTYIWILILRGIVGFGFGGAVQSFTLLAEYLPRRVRAKVLISYTAFWAAGSCVEIFMAFLVIPTLGWRWLVGFSAGPMLIMIILLYWMPESARFLMAAGKRDKALQVLQRMARENKSKLPDGALVESQKLKRGHFTDLFKEYTSTTLPLWMLWFCTAFSYYGVILVQAQIHEFAKTCGTADVIPPVGDCHCAHLLDSAAYKAMIIATLGEFVCIPFNIIALDWIGRKRCISISLFCASILFFCILICTPPIGTTIFIFGIRGFATSLFNSVYIYTTEVYPTAVRSLGLGSCSAMARLGAMTTPFVAQVLLKQSLLGSICVYGVLCMICAVVACLLPIETKNRMLLQTGK
ncbi:unnamed protein product [Owenia fusiformis]|uniref:Uncharacterized protein n=1 Tax=Owenia fusiformis TaxID=6347 RepID=A0A8J1UTF9_OWEFU|nr:unnamed protein product [Owenia fusiformis]